MRTLFFVSVITSLVVPVKGQNLVRTYYDSLHTVLKEEYQIIGQDSNMIHGPYMKLHDNGTPAVTGQFDKGMKYGEFKEFYADSSILRITTFSEGKRHGAVRAYANNGTLIQTANFQRDTLQGALITYLPLFVKRFEYSCFFSQG